MKKLIAISMLASMAFAANIKITSLSRIEYGEGSFRNRGAEVCGYVEGVENNPQLVRITADPGSSNPGTYWTWAAGSNDRKTFCHVVTIYGSRVEAAIGNVKASRSL